MKRNLRNIFFLLVQDRHQKHGLSVHHILHILFQVVKLQIHNPLFFLLFPLLTRYKNWANQNRNRIWYRLKIIFHRMQHIRQGHFFSSKNQLP